MYRICQCATSQANDGNCEKAGVQTDLRINRALHMRTCHILVVLEGLKTSADIPYVIRIFQWLSACQIYVRTASAV